MMLSCAPEMCFLRVRLSYLEVAKLTHLELEQYYSWSCVSVNKKNTMMMLCSKCKHSPHPSFLPLPPYSPPRRLSIYMLTQEHHYSCCVTPFGTPLTLVNISDRWGEGGVLCPCVKTVATLLRDIDCPRWSRGDHCSGEIFVIAVMSLCSWRRHI